MKKKIFALMLSLIMIVTFVPIAVSARTNTAVCDTKGTFTMTPNFVYQIKVTSNGKPNFTIGNTNVIKLISVTHSNNNYFYKIQMVGKLDEGSGIYVNSEKVCVINIGIGITETDDGRIYSEAGVLAPIRRAYDPSRNFEEHAKAINYNLTSCDLINNAITGEGNSTHAYVHFIQKDGLYGLQITGWRSKKSDNTQAATLNGALTAMVYLADSKKAGEAIWAWVDDLQTTSKSNITDYGFTKTDKCGKNHLNVVYKDGTKVDMTSNGGSSITILFDPA